MAMTNLSRWYWLKRREYRYSLVNPGIPAPSVPNLVPSGSWTGVAGSGGVAPTKSGMRVTHQEWMTHMGVQGASGTTGGFTTPAAHFVFTRKFFPDCGYSGDIDIAVVAEDWDDEAEVTFWVEGSTVTITPATRSLVLVPVKGGTTPAILSAINIPASSPDGAMNIYATVTSPRAGYTPRVIGPVRIHKRAAGPHRIIRLGNSEPTVAGVSYSTFAAVTAYTQANTTDPWIKVQLTSDFVIDGAVSNGSNPALSNSRRGVIEFDPSGFNLSIMRTTKGAFRPRINGLVVRKANINMENISQLYSEQGITTTASTADFRPMYFIDCEMYGTGPTEMYIDQSARSDPITKYGVGLISCTIRDIVDGGIACYRIGNHYERVAADILHWSGWVGSTSEGGPSFTGWTTSKDCSSEPIRQGTPGWHYTYSGAGTPTVEISGLNGRSSRTVTAKINGVAQTPTFPASITVGSGLYLVSDFVAAANAALGSLGFNFVVDNNSIRFAHSGSESATDIILPNQAVNMSVWVHGDWMQTATAQHDNSLFINNRAWNCEFQQFSSVQGTTNSAWNCHWINNVCLLANTNTDLQWQIFGNYRASSWRHNSHPNQVLALRWGTGGTGSDFDANCKFSNNIVRNMLEIDYSSGSRPTILNNHAYGVNTIPGSSGNTTGGTFLGDFPAITGFTYTDNDFAPSSSAIVRNFPAVPTVKHDINGKKRPALSLLGGTIDLSLNSITATLTLPENAIAGDVAGTLQGTTVGSTLALVTNADNRVALSGTNIIRGSAGLDFETNTSYTFTISETNAAMANSPKYSELTLNVENVLEVTLSALAGTFSLPEDATAGTVAGVIENKTAGSTLTLIDDAGGRVNLSGNNILKGVTGLDYETNTSHTFVVRETHPDGSNSPRDTTLTLNVTDVAEPVTSPVSAIAANGYQSTMVNPTELAYYAVPIIDTGYDSTGTAIPVIENRYTTKRIRLPYPAQASLTAADAALNDYVYSTATIDGAVNSSALLSPKPVASWVVPDRAVIGNTLVLDIVAFHRNGRNGKPVAAVTGTATDGTTTVTATTSTPIILGHSGDLNAVVGYRLTFDVTTLTNQALITANAKVFPHVGGSASVLDSSTGTAGNRGFVPLVFFKHTAKAANPPYVYVNATSGVDATVDANGAAAGITKVSTTAATAAANPFLTMVSAFNALRAATAVTGGFSTGCVVRIVGTVAQDAGSYTSATYQNGGELVIEGVAGSTPILTFGAASNRNTYNPYIRYRNIGMYRNGANAMGNGTTVAVLENVVFDGGAAATPMTGTNSHIWVMGMTLTNPGANLNYTSSQLRMARGIGAVTTFNIENWITLGCYIQAMWVPTIVATRVPNGGIFAFNRITKVAGSSIAFGLVGYDIDGYAFVQNIIEKYDTVNQTTFRVSPDNDTSNITHFICWHNTFTGFGLYGRSNILYDENTTTARTHKLQSFVGNIHTQINHKSDIFRTDGTRTGAWGYGNGVGCLGEFSMFVDAGPNQLSFRQDYPGLKANIGQSQTVRNDPLFTNYAGTTNTGTTAVAGAGDGTYTIETGSPAIGVLTTAEEVLPVDLAGNTRNRGTVGAYR